LAGQRSGGLGRDVRVVDVRGVQSHLIVELAEPIEQAVSAPTKYPDLKIKAYNVFNIPTPGSVLRTIHYTGGSKSYK
jgi:autonomous glycyl radical cofactor GrcA